jgi:hypothetical protein
VFCRADAKQYPLLEWELTNKPPHTIQLPPLDGPYTPDIPLDAAVDRFYKPEESALAAAMLALESTARTPSMDANHPANDGCKHLLSFLAAMSQLSGWQHVQNYISNPKLYQERTKSAQRGEEPMITRGPIVKGSMDDFQLRGQTLIKRLCQRVDWLHEMQRDAKRQSDAHLTVKLVAADQEWAADASALMKEAESKVTDMLAKNQLPFQAFRTPRTLPPADPLDSRVRVVRRRAAAQGRAVAALSGAAEGNRKGRLCLSAHDDQTRPVHAHAAAFSSPASQLTLAPFRGRADVCARPAE